MENLPSILKGQNVIVTRAQNGDYWNGYLHNGSYGQYKRTVYNVRWLEDDPDMPKCDAMLGEVKIKGIWLEVITIGEGFNWDVQRKASSERIQQAQVK